MEIVAFSRSYDRSRFGCGKLDLDEWLKTKAGQQERANNTRTFLAIEGFRVVGYYATTVYRLGLAEVAEMRGVGKRAYPMPAVSWRVWPSMRVPRATGSRLICTYLVSTLK